MSIESESETDVINRNDPLSLTVGVGEFCRFGILTASDRASSGEYEDLSGPAIEGFLEEALTSPWEVERVIVPDEEHEIASSLIDMVDNKGCSVVVTTGGTGPLPRDVTPEATAIVCDKMLPGFAEKMRSVFAELRAYSDFIQAGRWN